MKSQKRQKSVTDGKSETANNLEARKRDRAQYRCPEEVAELIEFVNSIPPDRVLPHPKDLQALSGESRRYRSPIQPFLEGMPAKFSKFGSLGMRYLNLRDGRRALRMLANIRLILPRDMNKYLIGREWFLIKTEEEFREKCREKLNGVNLRYWLGEHSEHDLQTDAASFGFASYTMMGIIGPDGKVQFAPRTEVKRLEGVIADRVRVCDVCDRIFWAQWNNMVACSSRCSATARQRRRRAGQAQYEQARKVKGRGSRKAGSRRK